MSLGLANDVKKYALDRGVDIVGIASIDRFKNAPYEDGHPEYYLPDAKAVVVIGCAIPKGAGRYLWGTYEEPHKTAGPYMWYGHFVQDTRLSIYNGDVSLYLEKRGYKTVCWVNSLTPTGYRHTWGEIKPPDDSYLQFSDFSHRHAAVAAGLGEFGLNNLCLTPEFGAHNRFNTVITNAPLEPDPMYSGPKICDPDKCLEYFGQPCARKCPGKAISWKEFRTCEIGGKTYSLGKFKQRNCMFGQSFTKGAGHKTDLPVPENVTFEDIANGEKQVSALDKSQMGSTHSSYWFSQFCAICLHQCPAPIEKAIQAWDGDPSKKIK